MKKNRFAHFIVLLVLPLMLSIHAKAAPITFNTALPVAKESFINREQFVFKRFKKDKSLADRDLSVNALVSVVAYGVNSKLAVFAALPYVQKDMSLTAGTSRISRSSSGLADSKFFARYTFLQKDQRGQTLRLAAFAGVKAPTGSDRQSDRFGILPVPLQSGSGSWDNFVGLVVTRQKLDYQIDFQLSYNSAGKANQFRAGNQWNADASFQYRLFPKSLERSTKHFVYAVLEANYSNQNNNRIMAIKDVNSGGRLLYLSPGLQYVTRKYILEAAIQIPVQQNLNGLALESDYIMTTGFRINF